MKQVELSPRCLVVTSRSSSNVDLLMIDVCKPFGYDTRFFIISSRLVLMSWCGAVMIVVDAVTAMGETYLVLCPRLAPLSVLLRFIDPVALSGDVGIAVIRV